MKAKLEMVAGMVAVVVVEAGITAACKAVWTLRFRVRVRPKH